MSKEKTKIQRSRNFKQIYLRQGPFNSTKIQPQIIYNLVNYLFLQKQQFSCFHLPGNLLTNNTFLGHKANTLICNIVLTGKVLASCANTYARKISNGVRLPSGKLFKSTPYLPASNFSKKNTTLLNKKASVFFWKKKKIVVRGVAKNASDHKHGGKGRGGVLRGF